VDLATTERLARLAPDRIVISESGISSRSDVERLAPLVDGFLVGSSLMRASDPAEAARALIFGRTKLCGLNCGADLSAARPAAFAGFLFVAGSPRQVTANEAAPLAGVARRQGMLPVGVFRDEPLRSLVHTATGMDLHAVQLHGKEDEDYVRTLRGALPPSCEIWTAVSVGRDGLEGRGGDRLLFDNGQGGTGRSFDWSLIADRPDLPQSLIAGGIGPHNARAAQGLGAYAIDIGSAVDAGPGTKSPDKIAHLFETLRPTARQALRACA
jgi:indole-3-glycerol phosphate synthase/phosphoribosylanthranilate isomerase